MRKLLNGYRNCGVSVIEEFGGNFVICLDENSLKQVVAASKLCKKIGAQVLSFNFVRMSRLFCYKENIDLFFRFVKNNGEELRA